MENTIQFPQKRIREILAYTIKNDEAGVKQLLAKNGFDASRLNTPALHIAYLKAIKDSPVFRSQVAQAMVGSVHAIRTNSKVSVTPMSLNFINQPQLNIAFVPEPQLGFVDQGQIGFVNQPQLGFVDQGQLGFVKTKGKKNLNIIDTAEALNDYSTPSLTPSTINTTPVAPAPASSGGFWDTLGGLASKDNLNKLFNTGLDTLSTSLKNSSNSTSEQNALEVERLRLQQIQAQNELANNSGMPTWGIVAIVVVVAGAIGAGIYFSMKKKAA